MIPLQPEHALTCTTCEGYSRPETFFYLDQPYFFSTDDYAISFDRFGPLAGFLAGLKGRFILSLNDCPEVRKIFSIFYLLRVTLTYSSGNAHVSAESRQEQRRELLISNLRKRLCRTTSKRQ